MQPDQAWALDCVEIIKLINGKDESQDLSIMLNYERVRNGASKEWLQKS